MPARSVAKDSDAIEDRKPSVEPAWFVSSVEKAFQILRAFEARQRSLSLTEIAEISGLDKSAAQRFTYTLASLGYLKKDRDARRYTIAPKILSLGMIYMRTDPLVARARHQLYELNRTLDCTVNMAERDDTDIIYVVRYPGRRVVTVDVVLGMRRAAYCAASGRAILATMPDDAVEDILARSRLVALTTFTKTSPKALMTEIGRAREQGFAVTAQETALGDISVAAPIRRADGTCTAAINLSVSSSEWTAVTAARKFGPVIMDAASAVSETGVRQGLPLATAVRA